jgi:AraC-like DNA-binding protein
VDILGVPQRHRSKRFAFAYSRRSVLAMMHSAPAHRWTVSELAAEVGMSRSSFAQRFSASAGTPPLDYLIAWRMVLAQRKLKTVEPIAAIAEEVGYSSQSAFAHAFKRTTGLTPRSGR